MAEQRSLEKKIVTAAESLFAQKGFAATGMRAIAQAAGVSIGAIYHHFKSKDDILLAIIREEIEELQGFLEELKAQGLSVAEITRRLVERHFQRLRDHRQLMQVVQREWFAPSSGLRRKLPQFFRDTVSLIQGLLEEGLAAGQIRPCNPVVAAHAIIGIVMGITPRSLEGDEVAEEIQAHGPEEITRLLTSWLVGEGGVEHA